MTYNKLNEMKSLYIFYYLLLYIQNDRSILLQNSFGYVRRRAGWLDCLIFCHRQHWNNNRKLLGQIQLTVPTGQQEQQSRPTVESIAIHSPP